MLLITGTVYKNASIPMRGFWSVWGPITPQKCGTFYVIEAPDITELHLKGEGMCTGVSRYMCMPAIAGVLGRWSGGQR